MERIFSINGKKKKWRHPRKTENNLISRAVFICNPKGQEEINVEEITGV